MSNPRSSSHDRPRRQQQPRGDCQLSFKPGSAARASKYISGISPGPFRSSQNGSTICEVFSPRRTTTNLYPPLEADHTLLLYVAAWMFSRIRASNGGD